MAQTVEKKLYLAIHNKQIRDHFTANLLLHEHAGETRSMAGEDLHCHCHCRFLPARQHSKLCKRWNSQNRDVRPSVHHTPVSYQNEQRQRRNFFTIKEREHSSFWKYSVHPELRKGSPRARAIYKTGVGTNWRFWRFFVTVWVAYLRNGARQDQGGYRSLIENRIRAFDWYQNQRP